MSELRERVEARDEARELRAALDRANRALEREKRRKADVIAAVERAATDAALTFLPDPSPPPVRDKRRRKEAEVAVVVLSDWQLGKRTPAPQAYDSDVCEERIVKLADKVLNLVDIQRQDHPVRELRVWALGDMVEGEVIFPGQAFQVDSSTYTQVFRGGRILADFLRRMAPRFERIHTVGVIGNHGRAGRRGDVDMETNWDRVLYRHVAEVLADRPGLRHLTWDVPEGQGESSWYTIDRIGRYGSLLFHGYNLKGHGGMPWYGLQKKAGGWALGAVDEFVVGIAESMANGGKMDIDFGHWHQPTSVTLNRTTARCNGSTESNNTYAREQLAAVGQPSQGLRFVHPGKGRVTAEYTVWLD